MANNFLAGLSTEQLRTAISLKEQIEALEVRLGQILGAPVSTTPTGIRRGVRRKRSAATRAKMAAAQKARWAKLKAQPATANKRKLSATTRAKMAAAAKARWAKQKATGAK